MLPTACRRLVRSSGPRNLLSSISSFPRGEITDANLCTVRYEYSPGELRRLRTSLKRQPIEHTVFKQLQDCGILRPFRGCRAGRALKLRNHAGSLNIQTVHPRRHICISTSSRPLHSSRHLIPDQSRKMSRNLVQLRRVSTAKQPDKEFGLAIALANMMSLSPKIDELRSFVTDKRPDLVSLTETWTYDSDACDHHLHIPGYNLILKNRTVGIHCGVGLYINSSIKFKALTDLYHPNFEVLWAHLRPSRLPRGYPCIVFGTVYHTLHPEGACDNAMLEYLTTSLTTIEGLYPGCGIVLTGDFNRLNINRLLTQFKLKQLVRAPTRGEHTLDLIITNMPQVYDKNLVRIFPPFGLSDHSVVFLLPKPRPSRNSSRRVVTRRDTRGSRRAELGRYLRSVDWSVLDTLAGCEDKLRVFLDFVRTGMDIIMPLRSVKLHVNDAPWITAEFKELIKARSKAFARGRRY